MTNKQAQELLIQNGQLVVDTLRHLADNEVDSDYFAITSTSENGTEIEHELVITEYARQAAGTVDELVKALEAKDKRIAELEAREVELPTQYDINAAGERIKHKLGDHFDSDQVVGAICSAGIRIKGEG